MNNVKIAALMIGRGGSTLPDKNILPVLGKPLLHYTAAAARASKFIGRFYTSSDCPKILEAARDVGYEPIVRPSHLSTATSQSADVVRHACTIIEKDGPIDLLIVQHANVGTITTRIIDDCIELMLADSTLSAVVPVHEKNEYHPFRAKRVDGTGLLEPMLDFENRAVSANRQDLPTAYFFDHSIWVLSVRLGVKAKNGQLPWSCMGSTIKPYITQGCFDVHCEEDIKRTEKWLLVHSSQASD